MVRHGFRSPHLIPRFPGMLSCQQEQNVIDGKRRIVLNPSEAQKREFDTVTFAEGEVWGIDILVSSGEDGKVREFPRAPLRLCSFSDSNVKRLDPKIHGRRSTKRILRLRINSR